MAQIIRDPSIAASLGQATGSALGQRLTDLAERRIQDQHKKQLLQEKSEAFRGLGLDPAEANYVAGLDPQFAKLYLENKGFGIPDYQPQITPDMLQQLQPNLPSFEQNLQDRLGTSPQQQFQQQASSIVPQGGIPRQGLPQFNPTSQMPEDQRQTQLEDYLKDPRLTPAQRAKLAVDIEKLKQSKGAQSKVTSENPSGLTPYQQKTIEENRRKTTRQENKDYNEKLSQELNNTSKIDKILDEIEPLLKKVGPLDTGVIGSLRTGGWKSKVAQRLDQEFSRLVVLESKLQGQGRGSDLLRKMVKEGKFSLYQDPEVMKDNLRQLREENQAVRDQAQVRRKIIKEHGGEQPEDLSDLVQQELQKSQFSDYDWEHPELWEPNSVIVKDGNQYRQINDEWVNVKSGKVSKKGHNG